jgi:hypothetical protein
MAEVDRQSQSVPEAQTDYVIISNAILIEAASGQFDTALAMTSALHGYFLDQALRDIAIAQANASEVTDAHANVDRIASLSTRVRTLVTITKAESVLLLSDQTRATLIGAYKETGSETDPSEMNRLRDSVIGAMAELGLAQDALSFALTVEPVEDRDDLLLQIVRAQAAEGLIEPAIETAALDGGAGHLERAQGKIAVAEAKAGMTAAALERADGITNPVDLSLTLSDIAVGLAENGEAALAEARLARAIAITTEQGDASVGHPTIDSRRKQGIGRGTNIPDCNCQIAASSPSETLDQGAMIRSLSQSHLRARPKDEAASRHWRIWPMA